MTTSDPRKLLSLSTRLCFGLAIVLSLACSQGVLAQTDASAQGSLSDIEDSKDQLIKELVNLTDAAQLEAVFSRQFIDRVANAVAFVQPSLDPATMTAIREETGAVVRERIESGDALYSVLYPVYEKHFDIFELNKLVTFYESPLGQKLVRVSPQLLTESLSLGREWGLSLVPEIIDRVQSRLSR